MSFKSIDNILGILEKQPGWEVIQQFQHLLACWPQVVGSTVTSHTRPLAIERGVLWVATSSSAWAQELTLKRASILNQLNGQLKVPLTNIRFSPGRWQQQKRESHSRELVWQQHPSRLPQVASDISVTHSSKSQDPHQAFQNWAAAVKKRSQDLPLCPKCQCPTPLGELARWDVCAICATHQWQG